MNTTVTDTSGIAKIRQGILYAIQDVVEYGPVSLDPHTHAVVLSSLYAALAAVDGAIPQTR